MSERYGVVARLCDAFRDRWYELRQTFGLFRIRGRR